MNIIKWEVKGNVDLDDLKEMDSEFSFIKDEEELFVIKNYNIQIGYLILQMKTPPVLKRIYIKEKYRGSGQGTKLLKYALNTLKNRKYEELIVRNHKKSNNFLEKHKFIREENIYIRKNLSYKKKKEEKAMIVIILNFFINIILAFLRIVFGYIGNSSSLIADGVNSLTDCVSNTIAIIGLKAGNKPEDEHHPFGHGKMESVMSIIIGTLIIVATSNILFENIMKLINGGKATVPPALLIVVSILSLIIKTLQYLFVKNSGKKLNNTLLLALSKDYKADFAISTSVVAGIFLSRYINPIVDPILGIIVILYIIKEGYGIIKDGTMELLDTQDTEFLDEVYNEVIKTDGVKNAHDFHMSKSGEDIYLFMDIRVEKNASVNEAHELSHLISKNIKLKYTNVKDVIVHVEPMY